MDSNVYKILLVIAADYHDLKLDIKSGKSVLIRVFSTLSVGVFICYNVKLPILIFISNETKIIALPYLDDITAKIR